MTGRILIEVIQLLMAGLGAPLLMGSVRKLKARLQGRRGASVFQPYRDLRKLLAKEAVISENTSWIFRFTPYLVASVMLLSALLIPMLSTRTPLGFIGNIIVLMYLLLLATFFLALAGLDAGSAFGGMGSSREMIIAALAEPTVMIAIFAIALRVGSTSLDEIVRRGADDSLLLLNPGHLLAFVAFFIVALAETGRLPIDNPSTHLELTMIHEAMILEYSGRHLALLSNLFFPWGVASTLEPVPVAIAFAALVLKIGTLAAAVAILETSIAKLRLFRVPELLSGSFTLALLAVISFFFVR